MRYPLGTRTRLFVGGFFLGAAALLVLGPRVDSSQPAIAAAVAILGILPVVLPSHAHCDASGISLTLLGMPAGRADWSDVMTVVTQRAPLRRVHVTTVHVHGRPRLLIPAELRGYKSLLGELARHRPDAMDGTSAALLAGKTSVASMENLALPLFVVEVAAYAWLAARLGII